MENNAERIFTDFKENFSAYAGLKLRLLKLMAIEKTAGILAVFSHGFILLLFIFFTVLFFFIALGFYLGQLLDNLALGFLIVGGIYLLLTLVLVWARSSVQMMLINKTIQALSANDIDEDDKNQSTNPTGTTDAGEANDPAAMS